MSENKVIKIDEIKELVEKEGANKAFENIKVEDYISFVQKQSLCDSIIEGCLMPEENTHLLYCDHYNKEIGYSIGVLLNYSNIELSEDNFITDYDYLAEQGIAQQLFEAIPREETDLIYDMLYQQIEEQKSLRNSTSYILSTGLNKLLENMPSEADMTKLLKEAKKEVNNFDLNNLEAVKDIYNKIQKDEGKQNEEENSDKGTSE